MCLIHVHAAHTVLTHATTASRCWFRSTFAGDRTRSKCGVLGGEVILAARRATHRVSVRGAANQFFKMGSTVVAGVFKNRHILTSKRPKRLRVKRPGPKSRPV